MVLHSMMIAVPNIALQSKVEFRLPPETTLGAQLVEYKSRTQAPDVILMRFQFPDMFPVHPPVLYCVRPRLQSINGASASLPLTDTGVVRLPELSSCLWQPHHDIVDIVIQVHNSLSSDGLSADMSTRSYVLPSASAALGATIKLPTLSHCMDQFPASCLELAAEILPELAHMPSGRVVLPQHCALDIYRRVFGGIALSTVAFHVEIKNCSKEVRAFAGMAEVASLQEPIVFLPSSMMRQLFLEDGDPVRIRAVTLPLCGCVYLQPQSQEFYEIAGAEPELVLQESLAPLPALTSGLSVQVEVAIAQDFQIGLRRVAVLVARLEDVAGNEVVAAKLPGQCGVLGDHEVRVELLPAVDLAESSKEYQDRLGLEAERQAKIQQMLEDKARLKAVHAGEAEAPTLDKESGATSGFELCFRLPTGKQLRHRCPTEVTVAALKKRLFHLLATGDKLWKPSVDGASGLDLSVFPRRMLSDHETVSEVGDRAVVHVTENVEAVEEVERSKQLLGAVLYPTMLEGDIAFSQEAAPEDIHEVSGLDCASQQILQAPRMLRGEDGLEGLSFAELRALALSLGLSAEEIARAFDEAELLALVVRHQHRAVGIARGRETGSNAGSTDHRASSLSTRRGASEPRVPNRSSQSVGARVRRPDMAPLPSGPAERPVPHAPTGYTARSARPLRGNVPEARNVRGPTTQRSTSSPSMAAGGQRSLPPLPRQGPLPKPLLEGGRLHASASPTHPRLGVAREPLRHAGQMMLQEERGRMADVARSASPRPKRR